MKILAQGSPNNTIAGFQRAAEAAGIQWTWWEERHTPAFDAFDEIQPDLVMMMEPSRSLRKCLNEFGTDVVQGFVEQPFLFEVNEVNMDCERLVDYHMFNPGDAHPAYECSLGIVSNPNPLGLQLCDYLKDYGIKIMCEEAWPTYQYLGIPTLADKRDLYRSSQVVLVDSMLEAMRVIACGSIPIPSAGKHKDFHDKIQYMNFVETRDFLTELSDNPDDGDELRISLQKLLVHRTYDTALATIIGDIS